VILDFWSTGCISCIEAFPKLDSLQKQFGNKLQIILITSESEDIIKRFFEKRKKIIVPDLPFVTSDNSLKNLFPHISYPFTVWIDGAGIVQYATDSYNTSYKKIKSFLEGTNIALKDKVKAVYTKSFFDEQWIDVLEYYSCISKCKRNVHMEGPVNKPGFEGITYNCRPLIHLYEIAFTGLTNDQFNFYRTSRTVVACKDSAKYFPPTDVDSLHQWSERYSYNYQLLLPEGKRLMKYEVMKADLDKVFNLKASIEQRRIKCLVLVRTSGENKLQTKGGTAWSSFHLPDLRIADTAITMGMYNKPYPDFTLYFGALIESSFNIAFEDSTKITGNVDIEFNAEALDSKSINQIQQQLKKYDLELVIKECLLEVLVLKETIR
jgi:thiol-disulfide isomerase/thioredoxin